MPRSDFSSVWERLPVELRSSLIRNPARTLRPDDVDALARAGAREAHALWLEDRPGRPRQWRTSWSFQRFVELARDAEPRTPTTPRPWRWTPAGAAPDPR